MVTPEVMLFLASCFPLFKTFSSRVIGMGIDQSEWTLTLAWEQVLQASAEQAMTL